MKQKLTEEEFIEKIRKNVLRQRRWGKWLAVFHLIIGTVWFALGISLIVLCFRIFNNNQQNNLVVMAISLGFLLGIFLGQIFYQSGHHIVQGITSFGADRTSELLIKYHDSIHSAETSRKENVGQSCAESENENKKAGIVEQETQEKNETFQIDN